VLREVALGFIDEFGADLVTQSPDEPARAAPVGRDKTQIELVRHVQAFGEEPNAPIRYVANPAILGQRTNAALNIGNAARGVAFRSSPVQQHRLPSFAVVATSARAAIMPKDR